MSRYHLYLSTVKEWQTLIGTLIGSVSSLAVAIIVSYRSKRIAEESPARLCIAEMLKYRAYIDRLDLGAQEEGIAKSDLSAWFAAHIMLGDMPLPVEPSLRAYASQLFAIDNDLSAHLFFFIEHLSHVQSGLQKIPKHLFRDIGKMWGQLGEVEQAKQRCEFVFQHAHSAARHARCAEQLLELFVLSRLVWFKRLTRRFWKTDDCRKLLIEGK
jgi:hypothetical protein